MKAASKTKKELIGEVEPLRVRVSELERSEKACRHALHDFAEKMGRHFPQMEHMNEAIFVVFDRKLEFVNDRFTELFSVSPEEVCSDDFNPMTLIEPESRTFVREHYREGSRGAFKTKQFEFIGLSKNGLKMECEAIVMFIPYKWGVAMHGMLRNISMQKRVEEALQRQHGDLQIVLNSIPTSAFYVH
jgi:PAS domain S-box-containing protein